MPSHDDNGGMSLETMGMYLLNSKRDQPNEINIEWRSLVLFKTLLPPDMNPPADQENGPIVNDVAQLQTRPTPETAATLLPSPIAGAVSLVAKSSSLYLRLGTFIGGLALDGARVTTLTGLELSRAVIEGILTRAGKDVALRARGELGKSDAEGLLERSISTLHSTITSISFAASTGFHFSSATLSTASDLSQHLLATLDSILGSTDSSRAIASIITLIRREFQNPATGVQGEKVGVMDLLLGLCGLALLQKWSRRMVLLEAREKNYEQIVWDVVTLDDGRRADVLRGGDQTDHSGCGNESTRQNRPVSFMTIAGDEEILNTIQRQDASERDDAEEWPETSLREHIMNELPPNASFSITTSTTTTKTIVIEVTGDAPAHISPPPGVEIVEEESQLVNQDSLGSAGLSSDQEVELVVPRYRVVYRAIKNKTRGTDIKAGDEPRIESSAIENLESFTADSGEASSSESPPIFDICSSPGSLSSEQMTSMDENAPRHFHDSTYPGRQGHDAHNIAAGHKPSNITRSNSQSMSGNPDSQRSTSANSKRLRKPAGTTSSTSADHLPSRKSSIGKASLPKKSKVENVSKKAEDAQTKKPDKRGALRNALKKGSGSSLSGLWNKDLPKLPDAQGSVEAKGSQLRPPWGSSKVVGKPAQPSLSGTRPPPVPFRDAPRAPQRGNANFFSSRDLGIKPDATRSPSRASFYSVHERRRDSMVSQTDTYSVHSSDQTRPGSPKVLRTESRAQRMEKRTSTGLPSSSNQVHRRSKSYVPSIYTINTNDSATSLVLASPPSSRSAFETSTSIQSLARTGFVDSMFPREHLIRNSTRFVRFASASYGSHFLRIMGIACSETKEQNDIKNAHHQEHHSFSNHTQLPADTILISSFVDPQGGTDATGQTNTGVPMVHYVSLDHESRAVVLTCRGTLGFEDVLTDMTCDYDELVWRGKAYKVHKGIHASARRLLEGSGGRVMATIKYALEEFPDYGLVLTGHSLGGGVTALLAIMISEPQEGSAAFMTSSTYQKPQLLLTSADSPKGKAPPKPVCLPPGRPIHVYAYGPPSTISPSLRLATRGLITTIVNGQDLVPYLSLGTLHDLQAVALAFKTDDSGAKGELRSRIWSGLSSGFTDRWYGGLPKTGPSEDDQWAYATLKTLRATMLSSKLVPPGEVFIVETQPVLQRHAFTPSSDSSSPEGLGRPATRATMRYVKDVETRFGELRFGSSMLLDHSPGRYEASLSSLAKGVLG